MVEPDLKSRRKLFVCGFDALLLHISISPSLILFTGHRFFFLSYILSMFLHSLVLYFATPHIKL